MGRTFARCTLLASVAVVSLVACGGDDDGEGAGGGGGGGSEAPPASETVTVVAESITGFDREDYAALAGEVTFVYENGDSAPHTLVIEDVPDDDFKLQVGDTDEGTIALEAGEYVIYCDISGHRGAGMEATLTVQ